MSESSPTSPACERILAVGLTPAWQQVALLDNLKIGEVNRASDFISTASGKVINVGMALRRLGSNCATLSVTGGPNGAAIRDEFDAAGIEARWICSDTPTRVCTTILDQSGGHTTELVENSKALSCSELEAFLQLVETESRNADWIVSSGSLPTKTPKRFHRDIMKAAADSRFVLDISGEELLLALEQSPFAVKPNREELARTLQRELDSENALFEAMRDIVARGAKWCVTTSGSDPIHATDGSRMLRFAPPLVENVVNPIGCGDCVAAGIAFGLASGREMSHAIRLGVGAASQNLQSLLPARLDLATVESLAAEVNVVEL